MALSVAALQGFRPAGEGGWIGYWSPRVGDPTFAGWLTVLLYFAAAVACFRVGRNRRWALSPSEVLLFRLLALGLVALGVNKQLDLQTALTELGRMMAAEGGWYAQRRGVQRAFIIAVGLIALAVAGALVLMMRRMPMATHLTVLGALGLAAFVVVRAASFHHFDSLLRSDWYGMRTNWVIEMGSILLVIAGASWRSRLIRRRA